ncbi:MAG: DUF4230 domain-containing protein [Chitinophagaceae bacterium]
MQKFLGLILIIAALYAGYNIGKYFTEKDNKTQLTQNYSFVRDIAELASIEVAGTTTLTSSNINNDGSMRDELRRLLIEQTVRLSAPYTAKYGVNLKDSSMRIERTDSMLKVFLPQPRLLSFEIHLNRLEASNRKGWFSFQNDEAYNSFQKKMYEESRRDLENNQVYLNRSREKVCNIIQKYFATTNVRTICIFDVVHSKDQLK